MSASSGPDPKPLLLTPLDGVLDAAPACVDGVCSWQVPEKD
ncbi:hypothetical protein [Microbacterium gilvum]